MSGKEAVRALRDRGMQKPPGEFGPALRTVAFALVAFVIGGGAVYGGVKLFAGGPSPAPGPVPEMQVARVTEPPVWTEADDRRCVAAFNAQAHAERDVQQDAMDAGIMMPTGGSGSVAPMGAQLRCLAATKPERFCDPAQRAVFVGHEIHGRSFKELAAETGVGVNTLLARKHAAVKRLRTELRDVHAEVMAKRRTP